MTRSKLVACVGLVCVDLVNVCQDFPKEDSDQRMISLHWQRGGNAGNTSVALSLLGTDVDFVGSVADFRQNNNGYSWGNSALKLVLEDLEKHAVGTSHVMYHAADQFPTSSVIVNSKNGSRTIMHRRGNLTELTTEDFKKLDLNLYHWIHFEERGNFEVLVKGMQMIRSHNDRCPSSEKIKISVELEKVRAHFPKDRMGHARLADMVFLSKEFALHMGWKSSVEAVEKIKPDLLPGAIVICTWGSDGPAFGVNVETNTGKKVAARSPEKIVDTVGAGDAFIAGTIHSMSSGRSPEKSVEFGCRVAERKITGFGFDHIAGMGVSE